MTSSSSSLMWILRPRERKDPARGHLFCSSFNYCVQMGLLSVKGQKIGQQVS